MFINLPITFISVLLSKLLCCRNIEVGSEIAIAISSNLHLRAFLLKSNMLSIASSSPSQMRNSISSFILFASNTDLKIPFSFARKRGRYIYVFAANINMIFIFNNFFVNVLFQRNSYLIHFLYYPMILNLPYGDVMQRLVSKLPVRLLRFEVMCLSLPCV